MTIELYTSKNGYYDYNINNHPTIKRACVGFNLRKGDLYNVYLKNGKKETRQLIDKDWKESIDIEWWKN